MSDDFDDLTGENTSKILENDINVEFGKFQIINDEYFTTTKLVVTVKNKLAEVKSYSIEIEAVDSTGKRIDTDTIYANSLGANQSQDFNTFEYLSDDKIELMKNATFKIVEISKY